MVDNDFNRVALSAQRSCTLAKIINSWFNSNASYVFRYEDPSMFQPLLILVYCRSSFFSRHTLVIHVITFVYLHLSYRSSQILRTAHIWYTVFAVQFIIFYLLNMVCLVGICFSAGMQNYFFNGRFYISNRYHINGR